MAAPHLARNGSGLELDKDWVRTSFMLPHVANKPTVGNISAEDKKWLYFTTASHKFTTTGLGGNFVVNPPPKYTRFADIPTGIWVDSVVNENSVKSKSAARDAMFVGGQGRYYSESIDDNSYQIHMRFGMPVYKGLLTFFTGFYNIEASRLAREGRISYTNLAGRLIGTVIALPLMPIILAFKAAKLFFATPSTKYYTSKPTMALYWNRVNMIATNIGMTKGLIPKGKLLGKSGTSAFSEYELETDEGMTGAHYQQQYTQLRKLRPSWFTGSDKFGGVDIQAIIGRPQAVANKMRDDLKELMSSASSPEDMQQRYENYVNRYGADKRIKSTAIDKYLQSYFDSRFGHPDLGTSDPYSEEMKGRLQNPDASAAGAQADEGGYAVSEGAGGDGGGGGGAGPGLGIGQTEYDDLARAYAAEDGLIYPVLINAGTDEEGNEIIDRTPATYDHPATMEHVDNGSQSNLEWLVLRVDAVDTVSETFSNSTVESEIGQKINSMASTNQAARFSLSDFNTGFKGIDDVIGMVKSTISGVASGLQLDGLVSLTGAGFVDIPERWDNATADFPSASYTMQLRAPYGDLLSQFTNIDVPLACLLAAALPISHGNQSYGAPFLCEMYVQGKNVIRLGLISSLSITRGTGNMGWAPDGTPLGIDVSFTIKDLSTVMHAPIDVAMNSVFNPLGGLLPRDSAFHDYMAVLGNMSVHSMTINADRLMLNFAQKRSAWRNMLTPGHVISALYDTAPGHLIKRIRSETGRGNDGIF